MRNFLLTFEPALSLFSTGRKVNKSMYAREGESLGMRLNVLLVYTYLRTIAIACAVGNSGGGSLASHYVGMSMGWLSS